MGLVSVLGGLLYRNEWSSISGILRHGIRVIIDNTYYKISIGPDIGTTLNNNSKIIKITDDEVVFTYNLDNDTKKKRLTVKSENKDIHFKLEDIN